jgi:DNA-directed RNA polymerase subunit RPC12/RpoP
MTSETRTTIEPEDIRAVELECANCGGRIISAVDKWYIQSPIACPNCNVSWTHLRNDLFPTLAKFANMLGILSRKQDSPTVIIRFELATPKRKE